MKVNHIEFIYFDLWWVVIQDFSGTNKWDEMLFDLWLDTQWKEDFRRIFNQNVDGLSTWDIESWELIWILEKETAIAFPKYYNLIDDFVMRFEENKGIEEVIKEIQKTHKVWLLTNMYPWMFWKIKAKWILPDIVWDIIIDSSEVKMKKPYDGIYTYAEKLSWKKWDQLLFIDNLEENLVPASKLWWSTILYNPEKPEESNTKILESLWIIH